MKFDTVNPANKKETLFQAFYLLFGCRTEQHRIEVGQRLCLMLMDSEISQEDAQNACSKAIDAHLTEKKLEDTFNG